MALTPIAAAWKVFSGLSAFKDCTPEALEQYRQVFYSGATMLFQVMSDNLTEGTEHQNDLLFLGILADEIAAFVDSIEVPDVH